MIHKDFKIIIIKYVNDIDPQLNYLSIVAIHKYENKHMYCVFRDIDMRLNTDEELLNTFMKALDAFIKDHEEKYNRYIHNDIFCRYSSSK